jgi:hypothetical protein
MFSRRSRSRPPDMAIFPRQDHAVARWIDEECTTGKVAQRQGPNVEGYRERARERASGQIGHVLLFQSPRARMWGYIPAYLSDLSGTHFSVWLGAMSNGQARGAGAPAWIVALVQEELAKVQVTPLSETVPPEPSPPVVRKRKEPVIDGAYSGTPS